MIGEPIDSEVTVTAGCEPSRSSPCPPPLTLVVALVVQLATTEVAGATAEKVKTTLSPWLNADPPDIADTLIVVAEKLLYQEEGVRIVTWGEAVNSAGIATLAEPKAVGPVSVIVIVNVAS